MANKIFTFVKNRQIPEKNMLPEPMYVWQHVSAGKGPIKEIRRSKAAKERLESRGYL